MFQSGNLLMYDKPIKSNGNVVQFDATGLRSFCTVISSDFMSDAAS